MQKAAVKKYMVFLLFAVALFARAYQFGSVPSGLNQDEAFAAYDAWSIMSSGVDSAGYRYPVYLTAWGSGMNALETYLMIPFFAVFGTADWVVRLPQLIVGLLSVIAAYALAKRTVGDDLALCFMALLAICPWHIMLSRWALESNLAPGFILFGMYFFVRGMENNRWLLLSALMYGLSLYCYATIWPIVPLILLLQLVYARKKLRFNLWTAASVVVLFLLALPLLLFLAVNKGYMEEICLPFMSIPKLVVMRSSEISLQNIPENLQRLWLILFNQADGIYWNSGGAFGTIYKLSLPFCILGAVLAVYRLIRKQASILDGFMLIQLFSSILLAALVSVNINRVNIIFIPLLYFTALGILFICDLLGKPAKLTLIAAYALMFAGFTAYYFGQFPQTAQYYFNGGLKEALEAVENRAGTVYLDEAIYHSQLLFYTRTDQKEFAETVQYRRYPATYLSAKSFGRYVLDVDTQNPDEGGCYILKKYEDKLALQQAGFTLENYGYITLAYK